MITLNKIILAHLTKLKVVIFTASLIPFLFLVYGVFTNNLGANPVEYILRSTGTYGLVFLIITLSVSPLKSIFNVAMLLRFRRMLGLFTFFYIFIHFLIWLILEVGLDMSAIIKDVFERPFISVGLAAFILLFLLAATSFNKVMRLMGKNWQRLHYSIYLVSGLAILHYYFHKVGKNDFQEVIVYGAIVAVLLSFRVFNLIKKVKGQSS